VIVMKALSREFRVALPWELLYADELFVVADRESIPVEFFHSREFENDKIHSRESTDTQQSILLYMFVQYFISPNTENV